MSSIKSLRQPLSSALLLLSAGLLVFACEKEAAAPLQPRAHLSVQIVSGDLQSGPAGKELPNPLVVKVVDATGLPQSGQLVNFRVTSGGGSVFAGAALTSVTGIAQERWTLGTNPADSQRVEARAVDNVTGQALTFGVFRATIVVPSAPVAAVTVAPASAGVAVGGTVQLAAGPKDASGNTLSGRVVTWASNTVAVASVNGSGLVKGLVAGSATITATSEGKSGSSAITVTAPTAVSCLTSPTITLSGVQTSAFANTSLPDNTQIDASTAQFLTSDNISIRLGGGSDICYHGGESIGNLPPSTSWSSALSHYSMVPDGPNVTVENVRTFDRGDGVERARRSRWGRRECSHVRSWRRGRVRQERSELDAARLVHPLCA